MLLKNPNNGEAKRMISRSMKKEDVMYESSVVQ